MYVCIIDDTTSTNAAEGFHCHKFNFGLTVQMLSKKKDLKTWKVYWSLKAKIFDFESELNYRFVLKNS